MKLLFLFFLLPFCSVAQLPGRADDSLRKISDTMHFPNPFEFTINGSTEMKQSELYDKCYKWITTVADTLQNVVITKAAGNKKIIAGNMPATADISFSMLITVTGNKYRCQLRQYVFHTINGAQMTVDKASEMDEYKTTVNVEKAIIARNYQTIFSSLEAYIRKST